MSDLREQLRHIYVTQGKLTPHAVVSVAADPGHPLHSRFEWDDAVAGPKYREQQARELIRSVRVVYREPTDTDPARTTRAFVAPRVPDRPNEYMPAEEVAQDPMLRALTLRQMRREWQDVRRRYAEFDEFWQMLATEIPAPVDVEVEGDGA